MKNLLLFGLLLFAQSVWGQLTQPPFTPATERIASFEDRQALQDQSLVDNIPFRSVGPTVMSGRVSDIEVNPENSAEFYVAYASGGLWKTVNNGATFEPLFDREMVMTIGDIAVDWANNILWLGSGEVNSSRSSYAGTGLFKSTDDGKSWTYSGLGESHHIGRILLDPTDPNTAWVAVLGHLYSPNQERGVYKTTDGGKTWEQTLFVNDNAGAVDLIRDPNNPEVFYAAIWERTRRAWNFVESGEGSGIYKSMDRGVSWKLMTGRSGGFPTGEGVGRIGLAASTEDGSTVLYAVLDNYARRPKEKKEQSDQLTKEDLRSMSKEGFLELEPEKVAAYLARNNFPKKYSASAVTKMVKKGDILPKALVDYVEDANSLLFDTPVIGTEVYRSTNDGKKWTKTHEGYLDDIYFSYGYYFGQIRVAANNPDQVYIMGVPILSSEDGGATWSSISAENVHADHHALWVNPNQAGHLINGNDGGINISYDNGQNWFKCNSPAVGQFYTVAVDHSEPYHVFGGLQDNGVWRGPSTYEANVGWHQSGQYPYRSIMGGDGMQVAVDTRDNNTVYTGYQFGNYYRINLKEESTTYITPKHELGERPLRWNWQTPIHLSVHNQDILYMGSNKLHRSFNQGDHFETISHDLTQGGVKGDVAFSTLSSIHESPLKFGLIYVGSDDGLVHVTRDGGNTWKNISTGLPEDLWVSRVQASAHEKGRVYVTLNGYRWDDFRSLVYVSEDYGATWTRIGKDLPLEPVNVIKEDLVNPDLLFVGTDHGLYVSLNRGASFMAMDGGLPAVAIHDLVIHPKANDLVVGTHGRSIYIADIEQLQQLDEALLAENLHAFSVAPVRYRSSWGSSWSTWFAPRTPKRAIPVFTQKGGPAELQVVAGELTLFTQEIQLDAGLNFLEYDLSISESIVSDYQNWLNEQQEDGTPMEIEAGKNGITYLRPGNYQVVLKLGSDESTTSLSVK
jgi:photosystem II stability/assembly factor-like uncharacterized protein